MKSALMFLTASFALAACSPTYPPAQEQKGTCRNQNCVIDGKPSQEYFAPFMTGVIGSCADQANMAFSAMTANFVSPKSNTGFAQIRLFVHPTNGTYTGAYLPQDGTTPQTFDGKYYLENSAMVLEGLGVAHKRTTDEIWIQVLSSSKLDIAFTPEISFVRDVSPVNENGQTVQQVCAKQ